MTGCAMGGCLRCPLGRKGLVEPCQPLSWAPNLRRGWWAEQGRDRAAPPRWCPCAHSSHVAAGCRDVGRGRSENNHPLMFSLQQEGVATVGNSCDQQSWLTVSSSVSQDSSPAVAQPGPLCCQPGSWGSPACPEAQPSLPPPVVCVSGSNPKNFTVPMPCWPQPWSPLLPVPLGIFLGWQGLCHSCSALVPHRLCCSQRGSRKEVGCCRGNPACSCSCSFPACPHSQGITWQGWRARS